VFVLLVPFVVHEVWDYLESRRFNRLVAEIRAAHEPTSLYQAERQGSVAGASDAAARYYRAAAALATPGERDHRPNPDAAEALAFLDRAASLPFEAFSAGTNYSYITAELLRVGRLAHERTRALASAGDGDGAAASLYAHVRLFRTLGQSIAFLAMLSQQVDDVEFVLSHSTPGPAALSRLAGAFAETDRDDALRQILLRERGFLLDRETRNLSWLTRPIALKIVNDRLENLRTLTAIASRPWPRPLDLPVAGYAVGSADARAMMRAVDESKVRNAAWNAALVRSARIAIAAIQYRRAHGDWPAAIATLVPEYLPAVPIDPYRGESMRSLVDEDGAFVAYSVGTNNRDDGGRLNREVGRVRPGMSRAMADGDLGVRVAAR
jgi:hypothetical protein